MYRPVINGFMNPYSFKNMRFLKIKGSLRLKRPLF